MATGRIVLPSRIVFLVKCRSTRHKYVCYLLRQLYANRSHQSAFSMRLALYGINYFKLFVPDIMHEFDLGVWKATFTHLIRILIAAGTDAVQELDRR